jgi:fibronectin type 3 domain-containing protein
LPTIEATMQNRRRHSRIPAALCIPFLALTVGCEQIVVTAVDVEVVEISPAVSTVQVGSDRGLTAAVRGSGGVALAGRTVHWTSLDPQVASVADGGLVRGLAAGSARIRAAVDGIADTAMVHVLAPAPVIALSPSSLSFSANQFDSSRQANTVAVAESAGAPLGGLGVEIAYPAGQPAGWISASLSSAIAPAELTVVVATDGLEVGTYAATVRVIAAEAVNSPQQVAITFTVQPALSRIVLSRPDAAFAAPAGGADPAPTQIQITNGGGGTVTGLAATVSYPTGQPQGWLDVRLSDTTAPAALTLSASTGSLPSGTHSAMVRIVSPTATNSPVDVPVTFAIADSPPVAPTGLQATAVSGTQIALNWTASAGPAVARYRIERRAGIGEFAVIDSVAGGVVSYQDTGLAPATSYTYRVQACNSAGCSPYSDVAAATTPQVPPGSPVDLVAHAAAATRIDLAWTASTGAVLWYRIERRSGSAAFAVIDSVAGGVTSYQDQTVAAGTHYTFRVAACNAAGCSAYSNEASATTGEVAPGAPTNLNAAAASATRIDLTWEAGSGSVASYRIERSTAGGAYAVVDSVAGGTHGYADTGLEPATPYGYRLRACNAAGCSAYSNEASATTDDPVPVVPAEPTAVAASAVSETRIDVSWAHDGVAVTSFEVRRSLDGVEFATIHTATPSARSFSDVGLDAETEYFYQVRACNDADCSPWSATAAATTTAPSDAPPATPSSVTATAISPSEILVTWAPAAGAATYRLRHRQGTGGPWNDPTIVSGTETSYTQADLLPGTTYQFQVAACNAAGCSAYSEIVAAVTLTASESNSAVEP